MKVFISQPMNGLSDEEIKQEREKIKIFLNKKFYYCDVEIIDSFFENAPHDAKPVWYLGESIKLLSTADLLYLAKDWENARGCKMERMVAVNYEIPILEYKGEY